MEGLYFIAAGLFGFAVVIILIAWNRWTEKAQSSERVEMLRAMVADSEVAEAGSEVAEFDPEIEELLMPELAPAPGAVLTCEARAVAGLCGRDCARLPAPSPAAFGLGRACREAAPPPARPACPGLW